MKQDITSSLPFHSLLELCMSCTNMSMITYSDLVQQRPFVFSCSLQAEIAGLDYSSLE